MRVPLEWLRDYVDVELDPQALADELTMRGMEVSAVELAGADWSGVVVGRLLHVERHPNADTLWLTRVDVGDGGELEIVCGAQNLEVGQLVPAALVGAVLPGDRRIERSKIRGVVSNGMLCSAVELGLGADADGIHILGHGDEIPPGTQLTELLGDVVLDVDVKPNRGDALSMVGLAREIAAFTGGGLRLPEAGVEEEGSAADGHVTIQIVEPELNPRFTARFFEDVRNGPSPDWMQRRLLAAGMRPISAVVDVTNYVMHELGQPMHAYDADHVPDGAIIVRRAAEGETLETIDHVRRALDERMLVIADAERPIGLAGIMGGASTEVGEGTTRVILESAIFHGPTIRNTARRLGLRSEASARHEKGIGADLPRYAVDRAARLIAEITGARVAPGIVDNDPAPKPRSAVMMEVGRVGRMLGIGLDPGRVAELLRPLGFEVEPGASEAVRVTVPPHRLDVTSDADLAEEIARAHGYERIPGRLPSAALPPYRPDPSEPRHRIRRILAGLGLDEMVSHALVGRADIERTGYDPDDPELVRLFNPMSEDHAILRSRMAPSMLSGIAENARWRQPNVRIFDLGKVYGYRPDTPTPRDRRSETAGTGRYESWELGIALAGRAEPAFPGGPDREVDVADLKGVVDGLHDALGAPRPAYRAEDAGSRHAHRHPGRTGLIVDAGGRAYGSLGEVHPRVVAAWGLSGRPVDASIDVGRLLDLVAASGGRPIPAVQPVDRDLAVVVADETPLGELLRVARTSAGAQLVDLHLFDVYRGEQIGEGRVSYAVGFRFQPDVSGDSRGVEKALNKVRGALRHHLGAEIR